MSERDLFLKALDVTDPVGRAALLDRECAGNPDLRKGVEALLAADAAAGGFLAQPHPAAGQADRTGAYPGSGSDRAADLVGSVIAGKYKLLQLVGEGGMGAVYMADQLEPIKRRVAVKLIRTERGNSKTILSRFEAERQAIALMDHPNIAKLLDAGTIDEFKPRDVRPWA
jgi:eukaryotic-like serine/threonine-protein kinase